MRVCDATVRKRLLEFEATPTSQLTVEQLAKLPQEVDFPGVKEASAAKDVKEEATRAAAEGRPVDKAAVEAADAAIVTAGGEAGAAAAGGGGGTSAVHMDPPAFIANR